MGETKGQRLKRMRDECGLTQDEVAKYLNVSKQTIYKYEKDIVTNIPSDKIELLAKMYHTTPAEIMSWQSPEEINAAEERQIDRDLEDMMHSMASAAYEGNGSDDADIEAFKATLKSAMIQAKKIAKMKYTPRKYRDN